MIRKVLLISAIVVLITFAFFWDRTNNANSNEFLVTKVIDGDTIKLSNDKEVRLLGIDTPEKGQYYYDEAKNFLDDLVSGKKVILEKDVTNKDNYGRYLRYVLCDDIFVNLEMVKGGYARVVIRVPDMKYADILMKAETDARKKQIGIWKN